MKNNKEEQQRMLRQLKKTELLELLIEENDENERLYRLLQEQSAGQAGSLENAGEDSPAGADFSSVKQQNPAESGRQRVRIGRGRAPCGHTSGKRRRNPCVERHSQYGKPEGGAAQDPIY